MSETNQQMPPLRQIIHGDNVEVLKTFPDSCIDLTVTSPPYDILDEDWKVIDGQRKYRGYSWNFPELAKQLYRVTQTGGVVVWVVNDMVKDGSEQGIPFRQALYFKSIGFRIHDTMIYEKANYFMNSETNRYTQVFEYMFVFSKGAPKTHNIIYDIKTKTHGVTYKSRHTDKNSDELYYDKVKTVKPNRKRTNIWAFNVGYMQSSDDKVSFEHPAIFPEDIPEGHITTWSNEGDVILDPFAGSGTTLKAAEKLNRRWVGIEISKEYIEIANKRLAPLMNQSRLL